MSTDMMTAVRLHGPSDLRVETVPCPPPPGPGEALIRVTATGICGSDLHSYKDARIGEVLVKEPLILGHEFGGVVEAVGADARDGEDRPLVPGTPVAVDPAQPCGHCMLCQQGHPNLCRRLHFCGNFPDNGSLCERIVTPSHSCFPLAAEVSASEAALLEPLGVALHTIDLAKPRVGDSVAILGAGCIGLLTLQLARLAGVSKVFVSDRYPWRLAVAERYGGIPVDAAAGADPARAVWDGCGAGADVVIEAAWTDASAQQAADMVRVGGRLVIAGISDSDELTFKHSTVRRKGLTIRLVRRMKHVYPRAIALLAGRRVDLDGLISHRFPLAQTPQAFALNAAYRDEVVKVVVDHPG